MQSIVWHRFYVVILVCCSTVLGLKSLSLLSSAPSLAAMYGIYCVGFCAVCTWCIRHWLHLEFLWERSARIIAPKNSTSKSLQMLRKGLNQVLSQKEFRLAVSNALNRPGVFKNVALSGKPQLVLDILFPDTWSSHFHLHCASAWIAACMPLHVKCIKLERIGPHLIFYFVPRDSAVRDKETLLAAVDVWRNNMQRLFYIRIAQCTVQDTDSVEFYTKTIPVEPTAVFEKSIMLLKEGVLLLMGFDGTFFYTRFALAHTRREYPSWKSMWSVWNHVEEVQTAFSTEP